MNAVLSVFLVWLLLSRLPLLLEEGPVRPRQVGLAGGILVTGLLACLRPGMALAGILGAVTVLHLLWAVWEQRAGGGYAPRLGALLGLCLLAILASAPGPGLQVRSQPQWLMALAAWFPPLGALSRLTHPVVLGALACLSEGNSLVRAAIEHLQLRPREAAPAVPEDLVQARLSAEYQRGRYIGVLERLVVYVLVVAGQPTALGFVLAAKAMARFRSLDDRDFAEYFLLGTLLSVAIAGALGLLVRGLQGPS